MSTKPLSEREFIIKNPSDEAIKAALLRANDSNPLSQEEVKERIEFLRDKAQLLVTLDEKSFERLKRSKENDVGAVHDHFRALCQNGIIDPKHKMGLTAREEDDEE